MGFGEFNASPGELNVLTQYGSFGWGRMTLRSRAKLYGNGNADPLSKFVL